MPSSSRASVSSAVERSAIWRAASAAGLLARRGPWPRRSARAPRAPRRGSPRSRAPRSRAGGRPTRARSVTEIHSPIAIEPAPASSPARPVTRTVSAETCAPATPITRLKFDSSPSLAPSTAARSALPLAARWRPSKSPQRRAARRRRRPRATAAAGRASAPRPASPCRATPAARHSRGCRRARGR